jgi:hypothetical protein
MLMQWLRLAIPNGWLANLNEAFNSLFQTMGAPDPWPQVVNNAAVAIWLMIFAAAGIVAFYLAVGLPLRLRRREPLPSVLPASAWVLSSVWLWHTKPEVWFTYYVHVSAWTLAGLLLVRCRDLRLAVPLNAALISLLACSAGLFAYGDVVQLVALGKSPSWRWSTYRDFVGCVNDELDRLDNRLNHRRPFKVLFPTFPDITVELSRRHPDWDFSRTNDFPDREPQALKHARETQAVVITEMLNRAERQISGPASWYPMVKSVWMNWDPYFLHKLSADPTWKPRRYICQRGRWQAFLYMD